MQPDFSQPAFGFVALATLAFKTAAGGTRQFRSDYRCQLRYAADDAASDVRVYLVGSESTGVDTPVPAVVAFLDIEQHRNRCKPGATFELLEGGTITAKGTVDAIAVR
jgi:hypothetical protein